MKEALKNPYLLSILSGVLCVISFPPFNLSFMIWIALIPFLFAILNTPYEKKKKFGLIYYDAPLIGMVFGMVFYFGSLHWIYNVFGLFGLLLLLVLCFYSYIFAYVLNYLHHKFKELWFMLWIPSILWVAIESIKSEGWWLKFSWMNLGYTQHNFLPILQFASILGQYGVTALIVLVNSFLLILYINRKDTKKVILSAAFLMYLFSSILFFGLSNLKQEYDPDIIVALIQDESSEFRNYQSLVNKLSQDTDFILLPEYALPVYLDEDLPLLEEVKIITMLHDSYLIIGSKDKNDDGGKSGYYNTAYLFTPDGEIAGRYYKMNPIQFFNDGDPGQEYSVFSTIHGKIGIFICYDMDYSNVARNIVKNGAEILFIPTYDAMRWSELQHLQHSAMTSMRAVENGRFIARAATSGISQIIEPTGKITTTIPTGVSDVGVGLVSPISKNTFYNRYGFVFSYLAILVSVGMFLYALLRKT